MEEACERYSLTPSEFLSWQSSHDFYGLEGRRATGGKRAAKPTQRL
jgi:hypothetical protein